MVNHTSELYLCSRSPRRQELLTQIGVTFTLLDVEIDETPIPSESPQKYVSRLAQEKAITGWADPARVSMIPVLSADTTVVCRGEIMGKPEDKEHGLQMLSRQSGSTLQVITAICLVKEKKIINSISKSNVLFRKITHNEMEAYWSSGESADKAGGWAIQGKAAIFIEKIEGSYSGVMGLPLFETAKCLKSMGINCIPDPC